MSAKPIPTLFRLIRERCGLTREEMADVMDVRFDTLRAWDSGQRNAPAGAIADARTLYQRIAHAGGALGARIDALKKSEAVIGLVSTEDEARAMGFPAIAAQHAAVGMALAARDDTVAVQLVPWQKGTDTAFVLEPVDEDPFTRGGFQTQARNGPKRA
jgi:DNA-binding XRE family transcriptional regulator